MEELKEKLAALGIDDDKIDGVITTVMDFIKGKLPEGMSGIVDSMTAEGGMDDLLAKAKGLFGG